MAKLNNEDQQKHMEEMVQTEYDREVVVNFGKEIYTDGINDSLLATAVGIDAAYLVNRFLVPGLAKIFKH